MQIFKSLFRPGTSDFLITSAGCCATRWLGQTLSQHPQIYCSSGAGEKRDVLIYGQPYDMSQAERIAKFAIDHFAAKDAESKPLQQILNEVREYSGRKYCGNIHHFTVESFSDYLRNSNQKSSLPIANIIRHPITRLDTHFRYWKSNYLNGPNCKKLLELSFSGFQSRYAQLCEQFGLSDEFDDNFERNVFAFSLFDTLNAYWGDFVVNRERLNIPHYKMEDLKEHPSELTRLVNGLTRGQIKLDKEYLAIAYAPKNLEAERFGGIKLDNASKTWDKWSSWQREMVQTTIKLVGFDRAYSEIGYGFSFLQQSSSEQKFISLSAPPKLIRENFMGFNLVLFANEVFGLPQSLGPIDVVKVQRNEVTPIQELQIVRGLSEAAVLKLIKNRNNRFSLEKFIGMVAR